MQSIRRISRDAIMKNLPGVTGKNTEISIFNYTIKKIMCVQNTKTIVYTRQMRFIYMSKVRSIMFNISKYPSLKEAICAGIYKYIDIPYLTHTQMCTSGPHAKMETYLKYRENINNELTDMIENPNKLLCGKGKYSCMHCKSGRTVYIHAKDKLSGVNVTCLKCNYRWKD
jgi:hypothetical protein